MTSAKEIALLMIEEIANDKGLIREYVIESDIEIRGKILDTVNEVSNIFDEIAKQLKKED